jgi:23S rRNA pseudouridine1911/1915/1917 synthase
VVNKPPNLIVHPTPTKRSGTLINRLLHHTRLSKLGSPYRPGVVHRLDKDTSGLLVFAKRDSSYINLVRQFMAREVGRTYVALVAGIISEKRGLVDAPIGRRKHDRTKMGIEGFFGKRAITTFETLERFYTGEGYTLLSIRLGTGRTHQIRVHMSYIGHPVVGDKQYGRRRGGDLDMRINRQALHAKTLEFKHPEGNKLMRFSCNLPNDLQDTITHLREISKKHRLHHLDFKKT